jgi:prepilin-type N-terminal cleavage/methylation domain-containing protein
MSLRRHHHRGFTLLEVMMVLALLGLMAGLFISAARNFTAEDARTPEDVFWQAVRESRKRALLSGQPVRLSYAREARDEAAGLVMTANGAEERLSFSGMGKVTVDFLPLEKTRSSILIAGQAIETQTLPAVTFYGDGTCSPFRAQIRSDAANSSVRMLAIDPWTCAEVLTATPEPGR